MSENSRQSRDSGRLFAHKALSVPHDRIRRRGADNTSQDRPTEIDDANVVNRSAGRDLEYQRVKGRLHERLIDEMNDQSVLLQADDEIESFVLSFVARVLENEDCALNETETERLAVDLVEETLGTGPLAVLMGCLLYTSPSPRDKRQSRMPSSA